MDDKIPASFEEAKELARRQMLAEQQAPSSEDDATPSQPPTQDEDAEDPAAQPADDVAEAEEPEDDESDDDQDDEPEEAPEPSDDEASDDDEPDDEAEPDPAPQKRKASRRSKRVSRLEQQNADLEAKLAEIEAERAGSEERILARLQEEQTRRVALEEDQRRRAAADRDREAKMAEYLGSDEEYQAAVRQALEGDVMAQERARSWHERRQVFADLSQTAEARVNQRAAEIFWASTKDLPGVDQQVLQTADFGSVLKHLHAAGTTAATTALAESHKRELKKRDDEIARLTGLLKQKTVEPIAKAKAKDPLEGGSPLPPRRPKDKYDGLLNPDGSVNRQAFEEMKRRERQAHLLD